MDVWWTVGISVVVVLGAILVFRLHAFLTLLLAGLLVSFLTTSDSLESYADSQVASGKMTQPQADSFVNSSAASRLTFAFGETAGKIGVLIALASVIGQCLLESRAAQTIVRRMLAMVGPKRAPEALAASSFVLGIPVFFDTVFYLMVPLARSLRRQVGKNYVLFVMAILAGGSLAHSLIPPTPGPLLVAKEFDVDIGIMLIAGMAVCSCSSVLALMAARVINHFVYVPLRFTTDGEPIAATPENDARERELALQNLDDTNALESEESDTENSPGLWESLMPIVIPVVLITIGSVVSYNVKSTIETRTVTQRAEKAELALQIKETKEVAVQQELQGKLDGVNAEIASIKSEVASGLPKVFLTTGDKNIAIGIGLIFAMMLMRYVESDKRKTLVTRSLSSAGNIILITAAGGAFGAMLRQAGIASAVGEFASGTPGLMLLPLAFCVTAAIRTLQGSATVAMITAAGVLSGLATAEGLPFHPVYLCLAIGAGSKPVSWMTDSAFWVITRMSGMTEAEGLKTLPAMSTSMGIAALLFTMIFASIFPGV